MKHCRFRTKKSANKLQPINTGPVITAIHGSTKKMKQKYRDAMVVLYNKANLQPIAITKPNRDGEYKFLGLNNTLDTFIVAFDLNRQLNAIVQDNVVPK